MYSTALSSVLYGGTEVRSTCDVRKITMLEEEEEEEEEEG
jgi:hypothetical protein